MKYTFDAQGKKIGRIASAAAKCLMGKEKPDYKRNAVSDVKVEIINASKADIPFRRMSQKSYKNFSGFAGGLKYTSMERMIEKKGHKEIFRIAVYGMLPSNKLRSRMIKNLTITE